MTWKCFATALLLLYLAPEQTGCSVAAKKGPPQRRKKLETVLAKPGEDVKIVCPVYGSPQPIIEWSKDGETIDHTWTRMKTNKNHLKLKGVQKSDTGVFICRGVNGFGSVNVRVELIVTNPNHPDKSLELPIAAPVFTKKTLSLHNLIKKHPGESLHRPCEALGSPPPAISWLHDGRPFSSSSLLSLDKLESADSGTYICLATNLAGTARNQFSVSVESARVELPAISHVANTSVYRGETAMLQCKVTSTITSSIQWLKEMVDSERSITLP